MGDLARLTSETYSLDMDSYIRRTYEPLKFLGRLFWVPLRVEPHTPPLSYAPTWEETGERWGPTVVARIPFTKWAVGLGVWLDADEPVAVMDEDAEFDAYVAVNGMVDRIVWQEARKRVAEMGYEPDQEMEIMQAMGIFE